MSHVAVVGCGVVGAAIAYELSQVPGLRITVLDRQDPAQAATGAALGVLMGAISQKVKGKAMQMRLASMQRYESLIPELEAITGQPIPFNRHGILKLCFAQEELERWQQLAEIRNAQGWPLEILDTNQLRSRYPQLHLDAIAAAIYSPQDRQVDPRALTLALVEAAKRNGVTFLCGVGVDGLASVSCSLSAPEPTSTKAQSIERLHTTAGPLAIDWLVIAAGLGTTPLTTALMEPVDIRPVLGQALHLRLSKPLGDLDHQPVITGNDVHIVPLGSGDYWIGATVEFPEGQEITANPAHLETVMQQAIAFCPALAEGTIIRTWSGLRPRPEGRPAPVIEQLPGYGNVILATGHYRNGILLAPATAQAVRGMLTKPET